MCDNAMDRSRKSKIEIHNYSEAIDEEILRLEKTSSAIDATTAESVISKNKEAADNKNIKNNTAVKRKKTLHSKKSSSPTHTEKIIAPQDDIIEPQFKSSKIVVNYNTDNEINIDKSVPTPMLLHFSNKVKVEEIEGDICIQNLNHSKTRKDIVKSELESKSYESISASINIKESSGDTDKSVGSAGITEESNFTNDIIMTNNKLIIASRPVINKLPTMQSANKIPLEPEVIKLFDPVKTKAHSLVKLIEMTTNNTEQLLKSIDNLDKDIDNSSKSESQTESISKSQALPNDRAEEILVENEKGVACKDLVDDPTIPLLDENKKHVTYRDTYVFEIDYVLETAEELFRSSTDPVDKKLEIDFRSYWCRPQVIFEETPTEIMLQDSIIKWIHWQKTSKPRESPVSYKCYICMKAWWHLSEFRDHIHTHNEHSLKVDIEKNSFECSIISYLGNKPEMEDIYIEGKCWKCRYGFEEHTLEKRYYDNLYTCYKCNKKFYTCTAKRHHEDRCKKDHHLLMEKVKTFSYECEQCAATFNNKEALYDHQIHSHCVRSDVPAVAYVHTCNACKALYAWATYHTCPKKLESSLCKYCGKIFSKLFLAAVHMNLTKSNVKCNFCERVLTKECLMMEHLLMVHSVNFMLVYRCRICPTPVLMRTPQAITRHREKYHSNVKCNVTTLVPIPKKCLWDLDASKECSLDEYKQDEEMEIITDTVTEQNVIEIIDSDEDNERDGTINIKTEIFEAEENKLQIDEYITDSINNEENAEISMNYDNVANEQTQNTANFNITNKLTYNNDIKVNTKMEIFEAVKNKLEIDEDTTNSIDIEENAMTSINYDNVDNEETQNMDNFDIANKLMYNNDINVEKAMVDDEYEKELYIDIPEECDREPDSEDLEIMKQVNGYENFLSKVFQASKFANASSILNDNVGATHSTETAKGDAAYASLDNVGVTHSAETANGHASLDAAMLQKVISHLQSTDYKALKSTIVHGEKRKDAPVKMYTCCVCSRNIKVYKDVKRHLIEHLLDDAYLEMANTGKSNFRCQICNSEYPHVDKYRLHMRVHASLPTYTCEVCNKLFINRKHFTEHQKTHNSKAVICNICDEKFRKKASLEKHLRMVHSTRTPLMCTWCPEIFYEKAVFKKHVRMEHQRLNYQPKCYVCGIRFERLKDQWHHMWEKHKQRKIATNCTLCDFTCRNYSDVKKHMASVHKKLV